MKVSVCIVTYNQHKYIRECLDSIVNQKTNFPFEVIVGDDASTDGTREIVQEYCNAYPTLVKAVFHEKNSGPTRNYFSVHSLAQGEYIVHLDGDDYALPEKLQKQSDFLDQNLQCCFVIHCMIPVNKNSEIIPSKEYKNIPTISDLEFLIKNQCFFSHSSKMYRRSANIFDHSNNDFLIDFFIHIEHASIGKIGFISEELGAHRMNCGVTTNQSLEMQDLLFKLTLDGFERARQLGLNDKIVSYEKYNYLLRRAFSLLLTRDFDGYKRVIKVGGLHGGLIIHLVIFIAKYRPSISVLFFGLCKLIRRSILPDYGRA